MHRRNKKKDALYSVTFRADYFYLPPSRVSRGTASFNRNRNRLLYQHREMAAFQRADADSSARARATGVK